MASRRRNTEQRLIELNSITPEPDFLRAYFDDASNHVVAKAARIAREAGVPGLDDALRAAFARFLLDPVHTDPGCVAKLALLEALDIADHDCDDPFRAAARHIQLEPAYDRPVDTATSLRIRGALGLVRLRAHDVMAVLADHLADHPSVQAAAARALAAHGDPAGGALVRLRLRIGIDDGEVLTDCLGALLVLDPAGDALALVQAHLEAADAFHRQAAALALGEARPDGAYELLRGWCDRSVGDDRRVARAALGLLRSDEAALYLDSLDQEA